MSGSEETEWFYSDGVQQLGPVSEEELQELRRSGAFNEETLVWHEGLQDWALLGSVFEKTKSAEAVPTPAGSPDSDSEICAYSKEIFPRSEMLQYGDHWVAAIHKGAFVQSLSETAAVDADLSADRSESYPADLTLTSIISQSWTIWRSQLLQICLVTAIIWTPLYFLLEYLSYNVIAGQELDEMAELNRYWKFERAMETWIGSIATGAVLSLTAIRWRNGPHHGLADTFAEGFRHYGRLLGTRIIVGFIVVFALLLAIFPVIFVDFLPFQIIWGIVLTCAASYYGIRICFSSPLAISEEAGGSPAIAASWHATKGNFWRIIGYQTLVFGILFTVIVVLSMVLLIPFLDNFVASAILSVLLSLVLTFGTVEYMVLALHLQANSAARDKPLPPPPA